MWKAVQYEYVDLKQKSNEYCNKYWSKMCCSSLNMKMWGFKNLVKLSFWGKLSVCLNLNKCATSSFPDELFDCANCILVYLPMWTPLHWNCCIHIWVVSVYLYWFGSVGKYPCVKLGRVKNSCWHSPACIAISYKCAHAAVWRNTCPGHCMGKKDKTAGMWFN